MIKNDRRIVGEESAALIHLFTRQPTPGAHRIPRAIDCCHAHNQAPKQPLHVVDLFIWANYEVNGVLHATTHIRNYHLTCIYTF